MDIVTPTGVSNAKAELFHVLDIGTREFEYRFYDDSVNVPPAPYVWEKSGNYEVDIYGTVSGTSGQVYLTTMSFSVFISGGPVPTCTLTVTPSTINPKEGESALLEWTSTNATTATINQNIGSVDTAGATTVAPNATTTYAATFTNTYGSVTCSQTVNVPDPIVLPLHEQAASLAKQLVNHSEAYLWGGKGWDFNLGEFTSPERILSGYTYFNPDTGSEDTGIGVDCSGLITWAFNRSYNPTAGFNSNYIRYVNADGMYRGYQSTPVDETELRPGDTLSFDWDSNGQIDHVAMYVGDSGGYDVVNAADPIIGIERKSSDTYSKLSFFKGFRRIHEADVVLAIKTGSPVNLRIVDPDGNELAASTSISTDEEYIREIPGELYYLEVEQGHDGRPQDVVFSPKVKDGVYQIEVVPEPGADPSATYSLSVELNGVETIVVDNETIDMIPKNGFTLQLAGGEIQGLDPTIKVLLQDLYQTVDQFTLSSAPRKRGLLASVESALSWFERNRTDQIIRKLTKLQNDINRHAAKELTPEELATVNQQIQKLLILLNV
jgi:cell wall-associated NlpC family hydrolase